MNDRIGQLLDQTNHKKPCSCSNPASLLLWLVQSTILPHHLGTPLRHIRQTRQLGTILTALAARQRSGGGDLHRLAGGRGGRLFQRGQESLDRLRGEILIVVIVDLDHGRIDTGAQAFDFKEAEQPVVRGVAGGDAQMLGDGLDNLRAAAAAELARGLDGLDNRWLRERGSYRSADLDKVFAHRLAVVHGVEGGDLVDTHWGHLQKPGNLVHDADAGPAELALSQVQKGHDGRLLVLRGVTFEDLIDEAEVLLGELERDTGVVVGVVAVLLPLGSLLSMLGVDGRGSRTTARESLRSCGPAENNLNWDLGT